MDELTLIARAGMWGLYRNQKGWHVEGYDKRNGRRYWFSEAIRTGTPWG